MGFCVVFFEAAIQPALVSISPMFADQYVPLAERGRRLPDTPAEIALSVVIFVSSIAYIMSKGEILDVIRSR